jgi:hypothetical protein
MASRIQNAEPGKKLEQWAADTLGGLPLRRAPSTLESRVLDELQRRAALPWWRVSFAHWPAGPRVAFVLVCAVLVGATVLGGVSAFVGTGSFNEIGRIAFSWAQPLLAVIASAGGLAALLIRVVPPAWLYGAMMLGALLYVALFGLGAAAYRTLYLRPSMAGDGK